MALTHLRNCKGANEVAQGLCHFIPDPEVPKIKALSTLTGTLTDVIALSHPDQSSSESCNQVADNENSFDLRMAQKECLIFGLIGFEGWNNLCVNQHTEHEST